jgi:mono/diheme cytochrome c family protein
MKLKVIAGICLLLLVMIYSCQSEQSIEFDRYYSSGMGVYEVHCQNCHGAHGEGLVGLIPPLTDTALLKTYKATLPCMIKNGMNQQLTVSGRSYNGPMNAINLTPIEVAQVATYVGNSFGNKLGLTTADDVVNAVAKCGE